MRVRNAVIGSIALAALAMVAPLSGNGLGLISQAMAGTDVSVSFNTFYGRLGPHGNWVNYRGGYVFLPGGRPNGWRPYTYGHWVFTQEYGWLWVSDEPFGWATYHYGRWGYGPDIGWYWMPGTRWA